MIIRNAEALMKQDKLERATHEKKLTELKVQHETREAEMRARIANLESFERSVREVTRDRMGLCRSDK